MGTKDTEHTTDFQKMSMGQRIRWARKRSHMNQEDVARHLDVSRVSISNWECSYNEPDTSHLAEFSDLTGVSSDFLLLRSNHPDSTGDRMVPLLEWDNAKKWLNTAPEQREPVPHVRFDGGLPTHPFALRVSGDAMADLGPGPGLPNGSLIMLDPDSEPSVGDLVVATVNKKDSNLVFRQLLRDGGRWMLCPINPRYPIMPFEGDILGVVVRVRYEVDPRPPAKDTI